MKRREEGAAEYNIFPSGHAGGDTFSKLKSKTQEDVKKRISEGWRNSEKAKAAVERRIAERRKARDKIKINRSSEIIEEYSKIRHIGRVSKSLNITAGLVSEILHENNVELNDQTKPGRSMPESQKRAIRNGLKQSPKINSRPPYVCKSKGCKTLIEPSSTRTFCSTSCKRDYNASLRSEYLSSIEQDFRNTYLEERLSCDELQEKFDLKQRSIYYLIKDFGLPTFSKR